VISDADSQSAPSSEADADPLIGGSRSGANASLVPVLLATASNGVGPHEALSNSEELSHPDDHRAADENGPPPAVPVSARRRRGLRAILPAPVWHIGRLLILALVVEYLVVPQLAGPRKVAHLVTEVNPLLLLAGVALEAASLLSYAQLTRTVLPAGNKVRLFTILRVELTTLSVSHCAPGGSATGAAIGYRLLTQAGVGAGDVGFALALQAIGSAVVLNIILWIALIVSIPVYGFSAVYLLAAAVGVALLGIALTLFFMLTRGEERMADVLEAAAMRLHFVDSESLRRSFLRLAQRLNDLVAQRRVLIRASGWAAANWLLDAASLWVFIGAFGQWVNPDGLLVAYGLAYVLAAIPITPGGLGVVEATLTSILVGFGTTRGVATLGVVAYRLINFWLPIPLGGLAFVSLQVEPGGPLAERRLGMQSPTAKLRSVLHRSGQQVPYRTADPVIYDSMNPADQSEPSVSC
jgi:putative heme transporter